MTEPLPPTPEERAAKAEAAHKERADELARERAERAAEKAAHAAELAQARAELAEKKAAKEAADNEGARPGWL